MSLASRLYTGETGVDFVGRRRLWFALSAVAMLISVVSLFYPGLNFGIDFKGGAAFRVAAERDVTVAQVRDAVGASVAKTVQLTADDPPQVIVETETLPTEQVASVRQDLARVAGTDVADVSTDTVGSTWGATVSRKALIALGAFLAVVTVYVSLRMELKMAIAALIALVHDLLLTAGVYALARFEVTPATVIALLTILGYSLYDTVVVFDKVRENTGSLTSLSRVTYSSAANLAVNQTMFRSLNTSLASLLPIGALLFVGVFLLGVETLKDLALALFVGVAAGTYSSMFLAPPLVAAWKEREPRYAQLRARAERAATSDTGERAPRPAAEQASPAAPAASEAPEPAEVGSTARRQQRPRPSQQRRKPSGRQASRPAKRRRR